MSKKLIVMATVAACISLYYFPEQNNFWAYMSISSYVAICSLCIALFLSCRALKRVIFYWLQTKRSPKNSVLAVFYAVILVILILFLPVASLLLLFCFAVYRAWQIYEQRQVVYLPKKQQ